MKLVTTFGFLCLFFDISHSFSVLPFHIVNGGWLNRDIGKSLDDGKQGKQQRLHSSFSHHDDHRTEIAVSKPKLLSTNNDNSTHTKMKKRGILMVDVKNLIESRSYPWTVESLVANAGALKGEFDFAVMVACVPDLTMSQLYTGGPLEKGVGVLFINQDIHQQLRKDREGRTNHRHDGGNKENNRLGVEWMTLRKKSDKFTKRISSPSSLLRQIEQFNPIQKLANLTTLTNTKEQPENPFLVKYLKQQEKNQKAMQAFHPEESSMLQRQHYYMQHNHGRKQTRKQRFRSRQRVTRERQALRGKNVKLESTILFHQLGSKSCPADRHDIEAFGTLSSTVWTDQLDMILRRNVTLSPQREPSAQDGYLQRIHGSMLSSRVIRIRRQRQDEEQDGDDNVADKKPLRIVVISDTHGYEDQFSKYCTKQDATSETTRSKFGFAAMPEADVLIHAGDFSGRGGTARLDHFLAAQTHIPIKIVIRGNHDNPFYKFTRSKAIYVSREIMQMVVGNATKLELRPYSGRYSSQLSGDCDIVVTHEPPRGVCDTNLKKKPCGSNQLRNILVLSKSKPSLVVCGHIHEARGLEWHSFGVGSPPTAVLNAANANPGRAKRLAYGPTVIEWST